MGTVFAAAARGIENEGSGRKPLLQRSMSVGALSPRPFAGSKAEVQAEVYPLKSNRRCPGARVRGEWALKIDPDTCGRAGVLCTGWDGSRNELRATTGDRGYRSGFRRDPLVPMRPSPPVEAQKSAPPGGRAQTPEGSAQAPRKASGGPPGCGLERSGWSLHSVLPPAAGRDGPWPLGPSPRARSNPQSAFIINLNPPHAVASSPGIIELSGSDPEPVCPDVSL